jgi:hypothetical protein
MPLAVERVWVTREFYASFQKSAEDHKDYSQRTNGVVKNISLIIACIELISGLSN